MRAPNNGLGESSEARLWQSMRTKFALENPVDSARGSNWTDTSLSFWSPLMPPRGLARRVAHSPTAVTVDGELPATVASSMSAEASRAIGIPRLQKPIWYEYAQSNSYSANSSALPFRALLVARPRPPACFRGPRLPLVPTRTTNQGAMRSSRVAAVARRADGNRTPAVPKFPACT